MRAFSGAQRCVCVYVVVSVCLTQCVSSCVSLSNAKLRAKPNETHLNRRVFAGAGDLLEPEDSYISHGGVSVKSRVLSGVSVRTKEKDMVRDSQDRMRLDQNLHSSYHCSQLRHSCACVLLLLFANHLCRGFLC